MTVSRFGTRFERTDGFLIAVGRSWRSPPRSRLLFGFEFCKKCCQNFVKFERELRFGNVRDYAIVTPMTRGSPPPPVPAHLAVVRSSPAAKRLTDKSCRVLAADGSREEPADRCNPHGAGPRGRWWPAVRGVVTRPGRRQRVPGGAVPATCAPATLRSKREYVDDDGGALVDRPCGLRAQVVTTADTGDTPRTERATLSRRHYYIRARVAPSERVRFL